MPETRRVRTSTGAEALAATEEMVYPPTSADLPAPQWHSAEVAKARLCHVSIAVLVLLQTTRAHTDTCRRTYRISPVASCSKAAGGGTRTVRTCCNFPGERTRRPSIASESSRRRRRPFLLICVVRRPSARRGGTVVLPCILAPSVPSRRGRGRLDHLTLSGKIRSMSNHFLLLAPLPQESAPAPPEVTNTLQRDICRYNAPRASILLFCSMCLRTADTRNL